MPFRFGPTELIVILVLVTMVFGLGKLPQVGGAIGKTIKEFRSARDGGDAPAPPVDRKEKG